MSSETTSPLTRHGTGILPVKSAASRLDVNIQDHGQDAHATVGANRKILLVDNGSLEPASTIQLRRLAAELKARVGCEVVPASIAHSSKISLQQLDGRPAELFEAALDRVLAEGAREIVVVPLFVGPSYAIVRHVPAVLAERRRAFPAARIEMAEPLFIAGETRLAQILAAHIRGLLASTVAAAAQTMSRSEHISGFVDMRQSGARSNGAERAVADPLAPGACERRGALAAGFSPAATTMLRSEHSSGFDDTSGAAGVRVAVVDHGSPSRAVTEVRDAVAVQVRASLGDEVAAVAACSMERRNGLEYAFNEPLLENLLREDGWHDGPVIVALLFIAPGKHAGPEGDIAQIVKRVRADGGAGVKFTPVMGAHPLLVEVLADRVRDVRRFQAEPVTVAGALGTM